MDPRHHVALRPRYADHYTGELFTLAGQDGTWTDLTDMGGHRTRVLTASFQRAYEALDVTTWRVGKGWELWQGDRFLGTLVPSRGGYSLLEAGERQAIECRNESVVLDELGLDSSQARLLF